MTKKITQQLELAEKFFKQEGYTMAEVKKMLAQGRISVNGSKATKDTVLHYKDEVVFDNKVYRVLVPDVGRMVKKKNVKPIRVSINDIEETLFVKADEKITVEIAGRCRFDIVGNQITLKSGTLKKHDKKKNTYVIVK